jgi:phosphoribosylaminoimidazolecarboxamide formyltransferase / IMP cyclohydrolase
MKIVIKNALLSVTDKSRVDELATSLQTFGIKIYATEGTKKYLAQKQIQVNSISDLTSNPEILNGRVKTLDYKLLAAILADRNNPTHISELQKLGIEKIDLVVVNLYDFYDALIKGKSKEELIEYIDIGGVTLMRAAAKNYKSCVCLPSIDLYDVFLENLKNNNGSIPLQLSKTFMVEAFKITTNYDYLIYNTFSDFSLDSIFFPLYKKAEFNLRYGENPHQKAMLLKFGYDCPDNILHKIKIGAREVSYNNIMDANAAFEIVKEFLSPTAAVVKHQNPAGVISSTDKYLVCKEVFKLDYQSSFGGILGVNFGLDKECAKIIKEEAPLLHCIVAPLIEEEAYKYLIENVSWGKKVDFFEYRTEKKPDALSSFAHLDIKSIAGGLLIQQKDYICDEISYEIVNGNPSAEVIDDLIFAFKVVKFVKSNAIVIAKNKKTLGIGAGQTSRVAAVQNAIAKVKQIPENAVLASDAFFPFIDSLEVASQRGIRYFIAPKGSVNDNQIIEYARKHDLTLLFTNTRHFRH